jgi:serine protease inhibitor
MKRIIHIGLICFGFLFPSLKAQEKPLPNLNESEISYFKTFVEGNNRFAFDLYQHLRGHSGNLYFSPYSIITGLGMAAIGVKGEAARQIQQTIRYSPALLLFVGDLNESLQRTSTSQAQVLLANALWLDKSISVLPSFKQTLMRDFRTTLQPVDFAHDPSQSVQKINQWVLQQTRGLANNMVQSQDLTVETRMVLTTAAELKGQWTYPFDHNLTKQRPFQIAAQRAFQTDMMYNTSRDLLWKGKKWDILVVPYLREEQGAQIAMVIFLPKVEVSLAELEKNLTWENWQQWKEQFQSQEVNLTLPRFRIDQRLNLETALKALNLRLIFSPEVDFSEMTNQKGIYLNQFLHRTSIRLDERGASMSGEKVKPVAPSNGKEVANEFMVDRPFVFMIWDQKTDTILFMGRLALP